MAKKDGVDEQNEEPQEQAPKENAMAKKAAEPAAASAEGLVKMMRGDRVIQAHPSAVKDHIRNGWKHA
jgi:hypothetical protein